MFIFLVCWHHSNPDSLQVTKDYEMQLLKHDEIKDESDIGAPND